MLLLKISRKVLHICLTYALLATLVTLFWTRPVQCLLLHTTAAPKFRSTTHQQQQCVCTQHNELIIYQRPSTHSMPIGNMYLGDCKLYYQDKFHTSGFLPILHYHQVRDIWLASIITWSFIVVIVMVQVNEFSDWSCFHLLIFFVDHILTIISKQEYWNSKKM